MRLISGNPFNAMKSFGPYSHCSRLNILVFFSPRVDAQKVYREMPSDFSLNTTRKGKTYKVLSIQEGNCNYGTKYSEKVTSSKKQKINKKKRVQTVVN